MNFPILLAPKKTSLCAFYLFFISSRRATFQMLFSLSFIWHFNTSKRAQANQLVRNCTICCYCCSCYAHTRIYVLVFLLCFGCGQAKFGPLPKRPNECHSTGNFSVDVCKWAAPKSMLTGFKYVQQIHNFVAVCVWVRQMKYKE